MSAAERRERRQDGVEDRAARRKSVPLTQVVTTGREPRQHCLADYEIRVSVLEYTSLNYPAFARVITRYQRHEIRGKSEWDV